MVVGGVVCFGLVSVVTLLACVWSVVYRVRWGEVDHWSLSLFGVGILWLLSSVASGLATARLRAPALYSRDLNRWLRLYALEWRWKEQQLRVLTPQQMARRRGKREKEQLREVERERLQAQRRAEEQAERHRLLFLEQLEREEDSEGGDAAAAQHTTAKEGEATPADPTPAEGAASDSTSTGGGAEVRVVGERRRRSGPGPLSGLSSALLPVAETLLLGQEEGKGLTSPDDYPQPSTVDMRRRTATPSARQAGKAQQLDTAAHSSTIHHPHH